MGGKHIRVTTIFVLLLLCGSSFFAPQIVGKLSIQNIPIGLVSATTPGLKGLEAISSLAVSDLNQYMLEFNHPYQFRASLLDSNGSDINYLNSIKQLSGQGVKIIVSDGTDSMVQSSLTYVNSNNMLLLGTRSKADNLAIASDGLYRLKAAENESTKYIARMMWNYGIRYACVIQRDDPLTNGLFTIFDEEWRKLGGLYTGENVAYNVATSIFATYLDKAEVEITAAVQAYKVEKIGVLILSGDEIVTITHQIANNRPYLISVPWFTTNTHAKNPLIVGGTFNVPVTLHLYSPLDAVEQTQMYNRLASRYFNTTGKPMNEVEVLAYDWFWIVGLSVISSGSSGVSQIKGVISSVASKYLGASGRCQLDSFGDRSNQVYDIWGYRLVENVVVAFREGWIESPTGIFWVSREKPALDIDFGADKDVVPGGGSVTLLGVTSGSRIGANITIIYWDPNNNVITKLVKIDKYAKFNISISPPVPGLWHYQSFFLGDQTYRNSSTPISEFKVLRTATNIILNSSKTEILKDISVMLKGSITPLLQGAPFTVTRIDPAGTTTNSTINTNVNGTYSTVVQLAKAGNWTIRVSYDGDSLYLPSVSNSVYVAVLKKDSSINVLLSEATTVEGADVSAYGQLSPPLQAASIIIEAMAPNGAVTNGTAVTASDGRYSVVFKPAMIGVWKFKARFLGDNTYLPSESDTAQLTVTRLPPTADIKIIVKGSQANPLAGVTVTSTNQPSGQPTLSGTTGSDGSVIFTKVKPGDYTFLAALKDYQSQSIQVNAAESQTTEKTMLLASVPQPQQGIPGFPLESLILGIAVALASIILWMRKSASDTIHFNTRKIV